MPARSATAKSLAADLRLSYPNPKESLEAKGVHPAWVDTGVPGEFAEGRWPEVEEGFNLCRHAVEEFEIMRHPEDHEQEVLNRLKVGRETSGDEADALRSAIHAAIQNGHESQRQRAAAKAVADGESNSADEREEARTCMAAWDVRLAEEATELRWLLGGFPGEDLPDPTLPGRTWLVCWPVMRSEVDQNQTSIQNFAALVVAPPGLILKEGDQHLLCKAEDAGKDALERDHQSITIKAMPVLLSRNQCAKWGRPMHWRGRVLYLAEPEQPKKPRKLKPE